MTLAVINRLQNSGCRTLVLTATELGRPVYERLGFRIDTYYRRLSRSGQIPLQDNVPPGLRSLEAEDLRAVCELDRRMTGEDRSHLIQAFSHSGRVLEDEASGAIRAYHVATPWGNGPIIATDLEAGWLMLSDSSGLVERNGDIAAWLTDENVAGREILRKSGFTESRRVPRMVLGESIHWHPEAIWGMFSLAEG